MPEDKASARIETRATRRRRASSGPPPSRWRVGGTAPPPVREGNDRRDAGPTRAGPTRTGPTRHIEGGGPLSRSAKWIWRPTSRDRQGAGGPLPDGRGSCQNKSADRLSLYSGE